MAGFKVVTDKTIANAKAGGHTVEPNLILRVSIWPVELWDVKTQKWEPYTGKVPKEIGWGDVVTDAEAKGFMEPI